MFSESPCILSKIAKYRYFQFSKKGQRFDGINIYLGLCRLNYYFDGTLFTGISSLYFSEILIIKIVKN